ncbi:MAG: response regulator [Lutibacter sp.]|uniref:LytR/AlgR family response regulator transcription factor n=1 Tax=Lutibacter sp. TaxID=1925666 RepID=UPI0019DD9E57|nr:LytTR family DNA-binding domain-containing protein [Lutibacter sp.]NOR28646.1 response regulator [Lutibacter sp.]
MINAIIIEDETAAYQHLKNIVETNYNSQIKIIGHETGVEKGIKLINNLNPQLIFLDIELQDGNGFEILDYYHNNIKSEVIFTTGLRDYKEKAMDYFAFYYLNKPIIKEQLTTVLDKFLAKQTAFDSEKYSAFKTQVDNKHNKITLPMKNGGFNVIELNDILYCEADGSYTHIFTTDNKICIVSKNLKKIESILPKTIFFRIHRSTLLNLTHIANYNNSGEILLSNNKKLLVSSRNKTSFLRILKLMNYSI